MKYEQEQLSDGIFQRRTIRAMGTAKGWTVVSKRFFSRCHDARIWCPGQHDCSAVINFNKSLPTKQASILIFMSPCGTLAFFRFHEKPPFLNSNWFSEGWRTRKTPLDHFLLIYWHGTLKNYVPLMKLKEGKQRSSIHTGGGGGCSHTWARKVCAN